MSGWNGVLSPDDVNRLVTTLLDAGLADQRAAIIAALSPRARSRLPIAHAGETQLFQDVSYLNQHPVQIGAYPAFAIWLERALTLCPDDPAQRVTASAIELERQQRLALPPADQPDDLSARPIPEPVRAQMEQLTGAGNPFLRVGFLEVGIARCRSVARVRTPHTMGTGFLIQGDRLVTCAHVLPDEATAAAAEADFFFEDDALGVTRPLIALRLDPARFWSVSPRDGGDDVAIVALAAPPPAGVEALDLGLAAPTVGDFVHVVGHPHGGPKRLSFYRNLVTWVGPRALEYLTDTEAGSSGSPVFDREWRVVGVHDGRGRTAPVGGRPARVNHGALARCVGERLGA